jgi:myosin heavy chain 6/7
MKKDCALSNNVRDYHFVSQGKITVDSIDDKEDMGFVDEAFDILGFTREEKTDVYKLVACVMHLGEIKFKKKSSKDDQAAVESDEAVKTIMKLIGGSTDEMVERFVQPKIKV